MTFGNENRNLQCLSSLANGCLRWLYPASSKTQVLNFFCCYTTQIIVWKIVLFFIRPSSTQDTEKNTEGSFAFVPPPQPTSYAYGYPQPRYLPVLVSMHF